MIKLHQLLTKLVPKNHHHIFKASYRTTFRAEVRSAVRKLICERHTNTASGARAFGVVAPKVWHDLPDSVRYSDSITSFKKNLKTYLYNQAFTS